MIIYDENARIRMQDYGMAIPSKPGKAIKAFEHIETLLADYTERQWHIPFQADLIHRKDLERVHAPSYINALYDNPLSLEEEVVKTFELYDKNGKPHRYNPDADTLGFEHLRDKAIGLVSGTYQSCLEALDRNFCYFFGGGMHHGHFKSGSGFCLLNDIVIAARRLQADERVKNIWVIDIDAHKGDGTAALTKDDDSIITLSIHTGDGWPLDGSHYPDHPSYTPSNIDIPMFAGEDDQYNPRLQKGLSRLAEYPRPDLAIVVDGSDPYEKDVLPSTKSLQLTEAQMLERDIHVFTFLQKLNIPSAWIMAGGYGDDSWKIYANFFTWLVENEAKMLLHPGPYPAL